jgi:hypothetical protein
MKNFFFDITNGVKTLQLRLKISSFEITDEDGYYEILYKIAYSESFDEVIRKKASSEREFLSFWNCTGKSFKDFPFDKELDSVCEFIPQAREILLREDEEASKCF